MAGGIRSGLRQGLGAGFLLPTLTLAALMAFSLLRDLLTILASLEPLPPGYHLELFAKALISNTVASAIPLLAALPFSGAYVDDIKSKFARPILLRSGWDAYLTSRTLVCFLLGGGTVALGAALGWGGLALLLTPLERSGEIDEALISQAVQAICLAALCGGFWAVLGMALSTFMESKYIAYASPFVVYYLLVILCERYFPEAVFLYPRQWLAPSELWPFGAWGVAVVLLELTALAALVFFARGKRRLLEL